MAKFIFDNNNNVENALDALAVMSQSQAKSSPLDVPSESDSDSDSDSELRFNEAEAREFYIVQKQYFAKIDDRQIGRAHV